MKLLKVALLPLAIALSTSLAAAPISTALPSNTTKPTQAASQKSASQQVMFVVSAGEGSIKKKGSGYELSLDLNSVQQTLLFTERPARFVKYIQKQGIKQAWYDKNITHNFSENAPNAVLSTQDAKPGVITITQMHMHGSHVRFMFHPIKPGMFSIPVGKVHEVALTIDGTTVTLTGGDIAGIATGTTVGVAAIGVATVALLNNKGVSYLNQEVNANFNSLNASLKKGIMPPGDGGLLSEDDAQNIRGILDESDGQINKSVGTTSGDTLAQLFSDATEVLGEISE